MTGNQKSCHSGSRGQMVFEYRIGIIPALIASPPLSLVPDLRQACAFPRPAPVMVKFQMSVQ